MATPIYKLQRELEYAQARQTYRNNYRPPDDAQRNPRPTSGYAYYSLNLKTGTGTQAVIKVQASDTSVAFFGVDSLGISNVATELASAMSKPKSLTPSMVKAVLGDPTPVRVKAYGGTGRPYWRYSKNAEGSTKSHHSAPISKKGATPTLEELEVEVGQIAVAKQADLGTYGRLYLVSERVTKSKL
jgi:hypothetical protein